MVGTGSFGNYDHTARTSGAPLGRRQTHDLEEESVAANPAGLTYPEPGSSHSHNDQMTGTGATSMPDVDGSTARSEKEKDAQHANDSDSTCEEDEDRIEENRRASQVLALARKYTSQSHVAVPEGRTVFQVDDENSPLNPNGPNFNSRAWAKALVEQFSGDGLQFRTTGVAFQNMNVFGFGSATDYQKDVLNVGLEIFSQVRNLIGMGRQRRIDILRDFDGVVRKGEMLVVLGPPGSGCTTFLKTIAGEHDGIFIDDQSYFNYQGMWCLKLNHFLFVCQVGLANTTST